MLYDVCENELIPADPDLSETDKEYGVVIFYNFPPIYI
jgi:hypothetical protein